MASDIGLYSQKLRDALEALPQEGRPSLRQIAETIGVSYEHVRKIFNRSEPSASKRINERICKILGLDAKELWMVAQRDKIMRRFGGLPRELIPPPDDRLQRLWPRLTADKRERLLKIAEAYVEESEAFSDQPASMRRVSRR